MKKDFNHYLTKYFSEYLPKTKGVSNNTLLSYKDGFIQFLNYYHLIHKKTTVDIELINDLFVMNYLDWLEENRKISINTRNQRLSIIRSFFKYLQKRELSYFEKCANIIQIEYKKARKNSLSYFTVEELKLLFSVFDNKIDKEYEHFVLLTFLYETASRVQEVIDLKYEYVNFNSSICTIRFICKGNKERIVPIGTKAKNTLNGYIEFKLNKYNNFVFTNKYGNKYTRAGVQYILNKYVERAKKINSSLFPNKYSSHSLRHSKAMHLLESGVNLIYIRDLLNHESVTTTEIYARANPQIKLEALSSHSSSIPINDKYSPDEKSELIDWLEKYIM